VEEGYTHRQGGGCLGGLKLRMEGASPKSRDVGWVCADRGKAE